MDLCVVVAIDGDDVPIVGAESRRNIIGVGKLGAAFDGDLVVVVEPDEVIQPEMAGE